MKPKHGTQYYCIAQQTFQHALFNHSLSSSSHWQSLCTVVQPVMTLLNCISSSHSHPWHERHCLPCLTDFHITYLSPSLFYQSGGPTQKGNEVSLELLVPECFCQLISLPLKYSRILFYQSHQRQQATLARDNLLPYLKTEFVVLPLSCLPTLCPYVTILLGQQFF